jgi:hypothetical protein
MSRGLFCLPTASVLPIVVRSGDFGTSPFFGQLTDKTLLAHTFRYGVPDAENNRRREITHVAPARSVVSGGREGCFGCPVSRDLRTIHGGGEEPEKRRWVVFLDQISERERPKIIPSPTYSIQASATESARAPACRG